MSGLAFVGTPAHHAGQPQPLVAGTSRLQPPQFSARSSQGRSQGRGWLLSCAASMATLMKMRKGDPQKPKRPVPAFFLFFQDFRKKNQKLSATESAKQAGKQWSGMTAAAKTKYDKEGAKLKKAYDKEREKYENSGRAELWVRDPNRPKRPVSAAIAYGIETQVFGVELKNAWAALDAKKKAAYEKQFRAKLEKYSKAMDKYNASGSKEKWKKQVGLQAIDDSIKEKALKEKEKAKALKEKVKAKALKEKEKEKAMKDKLKAMKQKEKEKAKAQKEKEKLKAKNLKLKQAAKTKKEKTKANKVSKVMA